MDAAAPPLHCALPAQTANSQISRKNNESIYGLIKAVNPFLKGDITTRFSNGTDLNGTGIWYSYKKWHSVTWTFHLNELNVKRKS